MVKRVNLAEKNGQWKGGVNDDYCKRIAFENYPKECFMCKSKENIQIHHKNRNRQDNRIENLIIVCKDCHWKIHEHLVDWSRYYGNKCLRCGRNDVKHNAKGYCFKCYNKKFMHDYCKEYYIKNREKQLAKSKIWYQKNKAKKLIKQKLRRKEDSKFVEYHRNKSREWYNKNKLINSGEFQ